MKRGFPSGDRTIQNPGLFPSITEGSERVKRAYVEDVTPQDWCVGDRFVIAHRSNVLDAGNKGEKYGFVSSLGFEEKALIKRHGRREAGNAKSVALSWGELENLRHDSDADTARIGENLERIARSSPNRLIEDEVRLVQSLGVKMEVNPSVIRFYSGSGRVTVTWQARTIGMEETLKLGIIAPPNDEQKREKMRVLMHSHPTEMSDALEDLEKRQVEFVRWWENE